jgi:hypothetical protein
MKHIDTDFIHICILDNKTVLVEAVDGVEIDSEKSRYANCLIENEMPGNYGMIIDRKADYSIVPLDVYRNLNNIKKLKAIAIVVNNKTNFLPISSEKRMYNGELEVFQYIDEAREWISRIVGEDDLITP